jgi:hypothetical protein
VRQFARCWSAWVMQHSSAKGISNKTYLEQAERFVNDFLAGRCMLAPGEGDPPVGVGIQGALFGVSMSRDTVRATCQGQHARV